jgi:hypothetical protein
MGRIGQIGRRPEGGKHSEGKTTHEQIFLNTGRGRLSFVSEALVEVLVDGYCPWGWLSGK